MHHLTKNFVICNLYSATIMWDQYMFRVIEFISQKQPFGVKIATNHVNKSKISATMIDRLFLRITSHDNIILAPIRNMDDCVDHARKNGKYVQPLKCALKYCHPSASASDALE